MTRLELRERLEHSRAERETRRACCMRRARARYWRIAWTYMACGAALGLAIGIFLGALSVKGIP